MEKYGFFFSLFWEQWGSRVQGTGGRRRGLSKSHFLMLSRRAAVFYCVAWGLFSPANLNMLQWPAWLWPPDALYRATTKAGECCLLAACAPPPSTAPPPSPSLLYSTLRSPGSPTAPSNWHTHTGSPDCLLWAPGQHVSLTERDRRQSLINHVYAAGAQNII